MAQHQVVDLQENIIQEVTQAAPRNQLKLPELPPLLKHKKFPGVIGLTVSIKKLTFCQCMCDTGASISVMPLSTAQLLGFEKLLEDTTTVKLADQSSKECLGILKDVQVVIDHSTFPTDFAVINMDGVPESPLLLGRPFLASTKALIDMESCTIELRAGILEKPTILANQTIIKDQPPDELNNISSENQDFTSALRGVMKDTSPFEERKFILTPVRGVDGSMEYEVQSRRKPAKHDSTTHLDPHSSTKNIKPFNLQKDNPSGDTTLVDSVAQLPYMGRKPRLNLHDGMKRISPPPPAPPF